MRTEAFALLFASLMAGTSAMVHPRMDIVLPRQDNSTQGNDTSNGACHEVSGNKITFFGWPDNTPPGANTAYKCLDRGYTAGGDGSYQNPLTIASAQGEFKMCEIIYIPYLKKYGIFDGKCVQCETDWKKGERHFDVWTGSNKEGGGQDQTKCEYSLTASSPQSIIRNPPKDLHANTGALYDKNSQPTCHKDTQTFPDSEAKSICH